jgi:PKD repeat protein
MRGNKLTIGSASYFFVVKKKDTESIRIYRTFGTLPNTAKKINYIVVSAMKPPVAAFSAPSLSGKVPLNVKFNDKSKGSSTSWYGILVKRVHRLKTRILC